jgi:hypothetical protein
MVRPVVVISALCALAVIVMSLLFDHQRAASSLDQSVYSVIYKHFVGERDLLQVMLVPTEPVLLIVVIGLVVMLAVARHRPRLAVLAVAGPLLTVTLNSVVLKPLVGRTINGNSLAFPSGHTDRVGRDEVPLCDRHRRRCVRRRGDGARGGVGHRPSRLETPSGDQNRIFRGGAVSPLAHHA